MTLEFVAPSPGTWLLDVVHVVRPRTRYFASVIPEAAMQGSRDSAEFYGSPFLLHECRLVHGFPYYCARRVPDALAGERRARTIEVFERRLWREDLRTWDQTVKPEFLRELRELDAVAVEDLADEALASHLERVTGALARATYRHFRWVPCFLLPVGDFLGSVAEWTGADPADVLGMLKGSSRATLGATDELRAASEAIAADPTARALLAARGDARTTLSDLRALPTVGEHVDAYVRAVGSRVLSGSDVSDATVLEVPELVLEALRTPPQAPVVASHALDRLEAEVPEAHRAELAVALADAREHYRIRDEKGYLNDLHALGLARRTLLEIGRRAVREGRLEAAEHVLDATAEEAAQIARGAGPSADTLAAHSRYRLTTSVDVAPETLGDAPVRFQPPAGQPEALMRAGRAGATMRRLMFDAAERPREGLSLRGLPASLGSARGPVRIVREPGDLARVRRGDIVVAAMTTPAFNVLLPYVAGIVTERGGALSHAAILAREAGVPAVVGCRGATTSLQDGQWIEVDGGAGSIVVVAPPDRSAT